MLAVFDPSMGHKQFVSCHTLSIFCHSICICDNQRETRGRQVIKRIKNKHEHTNQTMMKLEQDTDTKADIGLETNDFGDR